LPERSYKALLDGIEKTKNNTKMDLILALNYSSRWEIVQAIKAISKDVQEGVITEEDINNELVDNHLTTRGIPDPELLIRTSGERRISNYLLWQIAYAELYFTDVLWPDFSREHLYQAILDFQQRERRFGRTGDQVSK